MAEFDLGVYGIKVTVAVDRGGISSDLHQPGESLEVRAAVDALESLVLGHACAGVDITSPAYLQGIESAVDAVANHMDHASELEATLVNKITVGFVVQAYAVETGRCVSQEFVAGDQVDYEDAKGGSTDWREPAACYQPLLMVQPSDTDAAENYP